MSKDFGYLYVCKNNCDCRVVTRTAFYDSSCSVCGENLIEADIPTKLTFIRGRINNHAQDLQRAQNEKVLLERELDRRANLEAQIDKCGLFQVVSQDGFPVLCESCRSRTFKKVEFNRYEDIRTLLHCNVCTHVTYRGVVTIVPDNEELETKLNESKKD